MKIDMQKYLGEYELWYKVEFCSKIIQCMQNYNHLHLYSGESINGHQNGLFSTLNELCEFWGWDKSNITIQLGNLVVSEPGYRRITNEYSVVGHHFDTSKLPLDWNKEKQYGMFIGRASAIRMYAAHKHQKFLYKNQSLTSFNDDLFNYMNHQQLTKYLMHTNQTYQELISIKPYSDIDIVRNLPITPPYNISSDIWQKVYEKIGIEIVCETATEYYVATEKILRPMYYKRPFIVVGCKGFLSYLRKYGFQTFNNIFDEGYDNYEDFVRVDVIFSLLERIIKENRLEEILTKSQEILEYNHQLVIKDKLRHTMLANGELEPYTENEDVWTALLTFDQRIKLLNDN